jgi:NAD-specific glutamate dehydrogenase
MTSTLKINDQNLQKKKELVVPLLRKGISMLLARSRLGLKGETLNSSGAEFKSYYHCRYFKYYNENLKMRNANYTWQKKRSFSNPRPPMRLIEEANPKTSNQTLT